MRKRKNLIITLISILFILTQYLFGAEKESIVYFKDSRNITGIITNINAWNIELNNKEYYRICNIEKITTIDFDVIRKIKKLYSNVTVNENNERYTVELSHINVQQFIKDNDDILKDFYIIINKLTSNKKYGEFQLNFMPKYFNNIIAQFCVTTYANSEQNRSGFESISVGIGYLYKLENYSITPNINLGETFYPKGKIKNTKNISLNLNRYIFKNFMISTGFRYYLSDFIVNNKNLKYNFNIGIGYNFKIL